MQYMAGLPDKAFELAVVDPNYGINVLRATYQNKKTKSGKQKGHKNNWDIKEWDNFSPDIKYFKELFRVSKNQIIWGG